MGNETLRARKEVEEDVYTFEPFDNGAGPLWCFGNTCLVRHQGHVLASGMENVPGAKPLNNARWTLLERGNDGWRLGQRDCVERTREPSPIGVFDDGRLIMSVNPTLTTIDAKSGPAQPRVLVFRVESPGKPYLTMLPKWSEPEPAFTEHSYRSLAVDGKNHEIMLFQNIGYTHALWSFYDRMGEWSGCGKLSFPWGATYDEPQPIRVCYPSVALRDRAIFFCGVSDIHEPYREWAEYKLQLTGSSWDYDFRRLFFTWCPDVTKRPFADWLEVSSRDKTAGWITPWDLFLEPDGGVHTLWLERALDERLREKFFPGERQTIALNHALLRKGRVLRSGPLVSWEESSNHPVPGPGRFHVTPDNRLLIIFHLQYPKGPRTDLSGNYLMELLPDGSTSPLARIPIRSPLTSFYTATARAGCLPSNTIDLLGQLDSTIRYARISIED